MVLIFVFVLVGSSFVEALCSVLGECGGIVGTTIVLASLSFCVLAGWCFIYDVLRMQLREQGSTGLDCRCKQPLCGQKTKPKTNNNKIK